MSSLEYLTTIIFEYLKARKLNETFWNLKIIKLQFFKLKSFFVYSNVVGTIFCGLQNSVSV